MEVKLDSFTPAYKLLPSGVLSDKIREAEEILKECTLCPRECRVDRTSDQKGFCKTGDRPFVSSWGPHFGEERPLVGRFGSGTIFFSNCNLGCLFCQNYSISHLGEGIEISFEKLADIMLALQQGGCHNINLVTPTHQMPMILRSIQIASKKGLNVPIVYNCGGYESLHSLKLLEGVVDIYMPDFKYIDSEMSLKYSYAKDYPEAAMVAVKEMHRQVGDLIIDKGIALRGLLVRHLVLPEGVAGTVGVVKFIAEEISKDTYINIMDQYHPCYKAFDNLPLNRRLTNKEFEEAVRMALEAGLRRIDGITI
ncbi:MAG TPA: radical SAM protein [Thermodesulfovibrionales bacterium]|nr:radical SAM protein [Thermodesulfovibrionales bacterium]